MRLTVRERILIHLAEHRSEDGEYRVPSDVTQSGLADAVGIAQKHVPQYVRTLISEGLLAERSAHVEGGRQRRKAYELTDRGRSEAAGLRGEILERPLEVEIDGERRTITLRDALREHFRGAHLLTLLDGLPAEGALRVSRPTPRGPTGPLESPAVASMLGKAAELEAAYDWTQAAEVYRRIATEVPEADSFAAGVLGERLAYARFRAAMQADGPQEFRGRMDAAIEAFRVALTSFEKGGDPTAEARSLRCRAWVAFGSYWLAGEAPEKRRLSFEAWKLGKESMDAFSRAGADFEFGRTYNQLSLSLGLWLPYSWDAKEREAAYREAREYGERAIAALSKGDDAGHLATAYVRTLGVSDSLASIWVQDPRERQSIFDTDAAYWREAFDRSESTALLEFAYASAMLSTESVADLGSDAARALLEKSLEQARRTRDRFYLGCAFGALSADDSWRESVVDDPQEGERVVTSILRHAEEARDQFARVAFDSPRAETMWEADPYPDYYLSLSLYASDRESKRRLLQKALESVPAAAARAARLGYPFVIAYCHHITASMLRHLAKTESDGTEKRRLLDQAIGHANEMLKIDLQILPREGWDVGSSEYMLARLHHDASQVSTDPTEIRSFLGAAVSFEERAAEHLESGLPSSQPMKLFWVAKARYELGEFAHRLYDHTKDPSHLAAAEKAFVDAGESFGKADLPSRVAECHWKVAKVNDAMGEHAKAADHFELAAKSYDVAAQRITPLKALYGDHARYMRAWNEIEKAHHHHARQDYARARESYERTAALLVPTSRWKSFAPNYHAWAKLEEAEDLSRKDVGADAIRSFAEAIHFFEETRDSLRDESRSGEDPEQRGLAAELVQASDVRRDYCSARILLEEAKLHGRTGDHLTASEKHGSAAAAFERLANAVALDQDRRELRLIKTLAQAWQRMETAEVEASSERFAEAASLFDEARNLAGTEQTRLLALGHNHLCMALAAGTRFADSRDMTFRAEAVRRLESAASYYEKAGFPLAVEYAKASKLLLDAYVQLDKANEETDPDAKARRYAMVERILETSGDVFARAELPAKRDEVLRLLKRVREERRLAVSLTEILRAPAIGSTTAFETPRPSHEASVGLDRFEHADVHGSVGADRRTLGLTDTLAVELVIANAGRATAQLVKVEGLAAGAFDLVAVEGHGVLEDGDFNLNGRRLEPLKVEQVKVLLRPKDPGVFALRPRILYLDEDGVPRTHEVEQIDVTVLP